MRGNRFLKAFVSVCLCVSIISTTVLTVPVFAKKDEAAQEENTDSSSDADKESGNEEKKDSSESKTESKSGSKGTTNTSSGSLTNDLIKESEKTKGQAEQNKKNLQKGLSDVKNLLKDLETQKGNLENYIVQLDADLENINNNIDELARQIEILEQNIEITKAELEVAKKTEETQFATMKKRIKYMYERGQQSYAEMLFAAGSFSEFLNMAEFVSKISKYDRDMLNQYIANRHVIEDKEAKLLEEEAELNEKKSGLLNEQEAMEVLMADKEQEISEFESDISNQEAAIKEYEAYIAEQNAIIKELEAQIEAEKKRLLEENRKAINYDGGKFAWPAPDYTRISDEYGNRMHPTLKVQQFHNGLDLASPGGSRILAAYDGEVVAADYSSSMGNYVMIDHGDGLYTIYMHASALLVKKGQMVSRGEQIAKVGSTGRSTGNHLHFGVRLNGNYVSPWNYLG